MAELKVIKARSVTSMTNSLRNAALSHSRQCKEMGCTKGIFVAQTEDGRMVWDAFGLNDDGKIALLEKAKVLTIKDMYD